MNEVPLAIAKGHLNARHSRLLEVLMLDTADSPEAFVVYPSLRHLQDKAGIANEQVFTDAHRLLSNLGMIAIGRTGTGTQTMVIAYRFPEHHRGLLSSFFERVKALGSDRRKAGIIRELSRPKAGEFFSKHVRPLLGGYQHWLRHEYAGKRVSKVGRQRTPAGGSQRLPTKADRLPTNGATPTYQTGSDGRYASESGQTAPSIGSVVKEATAPPDVALFNPDPEWRKVTIEELLRSFPKLSKGIPPGFSNDGKETKRHRMEQRVFDASNWEAFPVVRFELEAMFGDGCVDPPQDGVFVFRPKKDKLPLRLLAEFSRLGFVPVDENDPNFKQWEGHNAPKAAARVLRHYVRLFGHEIDQRTIPWAAHLMRRMLPGAQRRQLASKLVELFAGAVRKRIKDLTERNHDFLSNTELTEIFTPKGAGTYIDGWNKDRPEGMPSDALEYIRSLPDNACVLVAAASVAVDTDAAETQDALESLLSDLKVMLPKFVRIHGPSFARRPVAQQIKIVMGNEEAAEYLRLTGGGDGGGIPV